MKVEIRALNSIWRYSSIRLFRCLQKPIQNGGMKPTSWNSIPTVFFVSPRWGKSRNAFELNLTIFVNSAFSLIGKAHPKWWYESDLVEFDPNGVFSFRRDGESRETRFELNLTIFVNSGFSLLGKAHPKWWYETDVVEFDPKRFFPFRPDGESRETRFELNLTIFVNSAFSLLAKAHPKWWYETDLVEFDPNGVFCFAPMGKVEKRVLNSIWRVV